MKRNLGFLVSVISGVALIFLAGVVAGNLKLPPEKQVATAIQTARVLKQEWTALVGKEPTKHLAPRRFEKSGAVVSDVEKTAPGVTLLASIFEKKLTFRLYGRDGSLIYEWPIDFFKIAPDEMRYPFDALIHGAVMYPNGDIIANLDGRSLVRFSACGDILWRTKERVHHSVAFDDDGNVWTALYTDPYNEPSISGAPFGFDQIAKFDPQTGEMLEVVDLVKIVLDAEAQGIVTANKIYVEDVFHLNDVEILRAEMADAFPMFEAGDIMLNSRTLNQIWVLDGKTYDLKWWQTGPMKGAHDPDFQPDGSITVFDNRPQGIESPQNRYLGDLGGSRILRIDPATRQSTTLFSSGEDTRFYTPYRGKHQVLDNGNILIAETDAGRAFEVTEDGEIVWEYINTWDEDRVVWITDAYKFPPEYADFASRSCPG